MGGNALSKPGVRLSARDYNLAKGAVSHLLESCLPTGTRFEFIKSYMSKDSFGDMDVLIESHPTYDPHKIAEILGALEIVRNGDVTSIGVDTLQGLFQIDLIKTPAESFDFACAYFAYNDLGNLMGRIAHKQGFKYGHDGLWYVLRDPENQSKVVKEILVSRDLPRVFKFMGYEYGAAEGGFDSLEEIFEYVSNCIYFDKDIYLLQNRNHHARVRDKKRKTYMAFLEWCKDRTFVYNYKWENPGPFGTVENLKKAFLKEAFKTWPSFNKEYHLALQHHQMVKIAKSRFNGLHVSELTGLQDKALGGFIKEFKKSWFTEDHFWHWAYTVPQEEVDKAILTGWGRYNESKD